MNWRTLTLLGMLVQSALAGENWPEFRGPTADGQSDSTGLPVSWSESENILWSTPILGRAHSSPVVWKGRIWLTSASEDGKQLFAVCVDGRTGQIIHEFKLFDVAEPREIHKFNTYSSPTPAIEDGRVYLSWGSYGLACLDSDTADIVWVRRDLECNHYRGPGSSPIFFENLLIQHYDGFDFQYVIALDRATGDTVWRTDRPRDFETTNGDYKKAYATPIVIEAAGRLQLISPTSKGTFAYDPRTGEELWRVRYNGFSTACRPLFSHGLIYVSTGFSKAELLAIRPDGQGDVTDTRIVWSEPKVMPSKPSPLMIGDALYVISDQGVATCLNALTGEQIWQARVGGNYSASPLAAGGKIYFFSEDGKTTVIAADDEYTVLAENALGDGFMASPAVMGDTLILRSRSRLYAIQANSRATGD